MCFGIPGDILKLIRAGYGGLLIAIRILAVFNGTPNPIRMFLTLAIAVEWMNPENSDIVAECFKRTVLN